MAVTLTISQMSTHAYVATPGVTVPGVMAKIDWDHAGPGTITIYKATGSSGGSFSTWATVSSALGTYHKTTLEDLEGTTQRFYVEIELDADPGVILSSGIYLVVFGTRQPTVTYPMTDFVATWAAQLSTPQFTICGLDDLVWSQLTDDSQVPADADLITVGVTVAQNALPSGGQDRCACLFKSNDNEATRWNYLATSGGSGPGNDYVFLGGPGTEGTTLPDRWCEFNDLAYGVRSPGGLCGAITDPANVRNPAVDNTFDDHLGGYYDRTKLFDGTYRWGVGFPIANSNPPFTPPTENFKAAQITQFDLTVSYFSAIVVTPPAAGLESTFTRAQAWRAKPGDGLIAWVKFFGVDPAGAPQTLRFAELSIAGPRYYLDGRQMRFGDIERNASNRYAQLEGSPVTFTIADTDQLARGFFGNAHQRVVYGVEVVVEIQRLEDFWAGLDPVVVYRGLVRHYNAPPGWLFTFDCQSYLDNQAGQETPLPVIKEAFPSAPADTRDTHGELWYGRHSDAASASPGPLPASETASGASLVTSILGQAGIGELGETPPAGLVIAEDGAGDLQAGNVVYGSYTRVVAGVESDAHPFFPNGAPFTISGSGVGVRMTGVADGADSYRFYAGAFFAPGVRFNQYLETTDPATGVVFTKIPGLGSILIQDAINITPGATLAPYNALFVYGMTALVADGETPMTATWNAGSGPYRRPIRIVATPVTDAQEYRLWRRDISPAIFTRRWAIPPSSINGDGNIVFDDSLLDDSPLLSFVTQTAPMGAVPCKRVGQVLDLSGTPREAFAIAAHAVAEVEDLFYVEGETVLRVEDGMFGSSFLSPNKPNFSTYFPARYYDAPNGTRWTLVFAMGPHATAIVEGRATLRANIKGVEAIGNGVGTFLSTLPDQLAHFLDNFALANSADVYAGGLWGALPLWTDGTPRRDAASFTATLATMSALGLPAVGGFAVRTPETMVTVVAKVVSSFDGAYGPSREGAFRLWLEDPLPASTTADVEYDTDQDAEGDSFEWDDDTDPSAFYQDEIVQFIPVYGASGHTYTGEKRIRAASVPAAYRSRRAPARVELEACRSEYGAALIGQRRSDRAKDPLRSAPFRTGIPGVLRELGEVAAMTARQGPGASGWVATLAMIRGVRCSITTGRVTLLVRELVAGSLTAGLSLEGQMIEFPLGGSLVHSPVLSASSPQTVEAHDPPGDPPKVQWSALPSTVTVQVVGRAKVQAGVTSIKVIAWSETDAAQVGESAVITATSLTDFTIPITRPGAVDKQYSLKAIVVGGAEHLAVQFKGQIRVSP